MALNPPLSVEGFPYRIENEYMLAERTGVAIEAETRGMSKLSAKGKLYLSSARLLFVNSKWESSVFKALDMPVSHLSDVKFEQPIFGSNYLRFTCRPFRSLLPAAIQVKLYFTEGGVEKLLKIFEQVSKEVYDQLRAGRMNNVLQEQWRGGAFSQKAYYDPSDPTVIFTQQPPIFNPSGQFVGTDIYSQRGQPLPNNQRQEGPYYPTPAHPPCATSDSSPYPSLPAELVPQFTAEHSAPVVFPSPPPILDFPPPTFDYPILPPNNDAPNDYRIDSKANGRSTPNDKLPPIASAPQFGERSTAAQQRDAAIYYEFPTSKPTFY